MKFKIRFSILLLVLVIILIFNENISIGEFHTGGDSEFPFEDVLDYVPTFAIYNSLVPEDWKLTNGDYYAMIRGGICSIPLVGALLDSSFSVFFGKAFPGKQYVEKKDFEKRMNQLTQDMKRFTTEYVDAEIQKSVVRTFHLEFNGLRQCSQNYNNLIRVWNYQINKTGVADSQLKDNLPVIYWIFLTKAEDSLVSFSDPQYIHRIAKVYIETTLYYLSLLRDGHYNGISMGLSRELVNGIPDSSSIETFANKLNTHTSIAIENIALIYANLIIDQSKKRKCYSFERKDGFCKLIYKNIPNFSLVVSRILYSNLQNYNGKILFLKGNDGGINYFKSNSTININVTNSVSVIDFLLMGKSIKGGIINKQPYESYSQVCDFVTGMIGYHFTNAIINDRGFIPDFVNFNSKFIYSDPTITYGKSYFYTNIVLNQSTNKNVKFRIYFAEPVWWLHILLHDTDFELIIGRVKPGENELTYDPIILDGNDSFKNYFTLMNKRSNKDTDTFTNSDGFKLKRITNNYNRDINSRYCFETPSFNFQDSIYAYFEFRPKFYFSLNLLSLEIITSSTSS